MTATAQLSDLQETPLTALLAEVGIRHEPSPLVRHRALYRGDEALGDFTYEGALALVVRAREAA